jgi:6-phosphogluconolactonase (cycloisomerase 2 family)
MSVILSSATRRIVLTSDVSNLVITSDASHFALSSDARYLSLFDNGHDEVTEIRIDKNTKRLDLKNKDVFLELGRAP